MLALLLLVLGVSCTVEGVCNEKFGVVECDRVTKETRIRNLHKIRRLVISGVEEFAYTQKDLPLITNLAIKDSPKINCSIFRTWDIDITITVNDRPCNAVSLSFDFVYFFSVKWIFQNHWYTKASCINIVISKSWVIFNLSLYIYKYKHLIYFRNPQLNCSLPLKNPSALGKQHLVFDPEYFQPWLPLQHQTTMNQPLLIFHQLLFSLLNSQHCHNVSIY